jgi:hypothetical protein
MHCHAPTPTVHTKPDRRPPRYFVPLQQYLVEGRKASFVVGGDIVFDYDRPPGFKERPSAANPWIDPKPTPLEEILNEATEIRGSWKPNVH